MLGVLYSSISLSGPEGKSALESAVSKLLQSANASEAKALWSLHYTQLGRSTGDATETQPSKVTVHPNNVLIFPPPSLDLAFDDTVLETVKEAWKIVLGDEAVDDEFMVFEDRENYDEE